MERNLADKASSSSERINSLIKDLTWDDMMICHDARLELVKIGAPAVDYLVQAMADHGRKAWVRWEATKTLGEIADPRALEALIDSLEDKNFDIRWMAAKSLVPFGGQTVKPILERLIRRPESAWLRLSAHHVFRDLSGTDLAEALKPVIDAIDSNDPAVQIPVAAKKALDLIT